MCPLFGTVVTSALDTTITFFSLSEDKGLPVSFIVSTPPACAEFAVTVAVNDGPEGVNVTVFSVLKTNCVSTLLDESLRVFVPNAENGSTNRLLLGSCRTALPPVRTISATVLCVASASNTERTSAKFLPAFILISNRNNLNCPVDVPIVPEWYSKPLTLAEPIAFPAAVVVPKVLLDIALAAASCNAISLSPWKSKVPTTSSMKTKLPKVCVKTLASLVVKSVALSISNGVGAINWTFCPFT